MKLAEHKSQVFARAPGFWEAGILSVPEAYLEIDNSLPYRQQQLIARLFAEGSIRIKVVRPIEERE